MAGKVITGDKAMSDSLKAAKDSGSMKGMVSIASGKQLNATKFSGIAKGAAGEPFAHENEQVTIILSGGIEFHLGEDIVVLRAGDSIFIPPNVIHYGIAIEDETTVVDIFSPPRKYMD